MFSSIKLWLAAAGAALVSALVIAAKVYKKQRDVAVEKVDTLKATVKSERKKKKIVKEQKKVLASRRAEVKKSIDILKEVQKGEKDAEEFKGVDSLTNSNDHSKW